MTRSGKFNLVAMIVLVLAGSALALHHPNAALFLTLIGGSFLGRADEAAMRQKADERILNRARLRVPGQQYAPPPRPIDAAPPARPSR